jgi:diguanylate cyclase (GGDEF)-like protein
VMALRLDTYDAITLAAGKDIADVVLTRIAKLVMQKVRGGDSVARVAAATFAMLAPGTAASDAIALAQRLRQELDDARVTYKEQPLKFVTSIGVASIAADPSNAVEDLIRLAVQRLQASTQPRTLTPSPQPRAGLPDDLERVLRYLEGADTSRLADDTINLFVRRLSQIAQSIKDKKR